MRTFLLLVVVALVFAGACGAEERALLASDHADLSYAEKETPA